MRVLQATTGLGGIGFGWLLGLVAALVPDQVGLLLPVLCLLTATLWGWWLAYALRSRDSRHRKVTLWLLVDTLPLLVLLCFPDNVDHFYRSRALDLTMIAIYAPVVWPGVLVFKAFAGGLHQIMGGGALCCGDTGPSVVLSLWINLSVIAALQSTTVVVLLSRLYMFKGRAS